MIPKRNIPASKRLEQKALDAIGGEPLEGSGFEDETPEPEFKAQEPEGEPR
jgi:hypothetical protein